MPLTDIACRKATTPPGERKQYKLSDGEGLYLLVTKKGDGRYWRLDYRFGGKHKTIALGVYPAVSLAQARERRASARRLLANGVDPATERQREKTAVAVAGVTFESVAREWFENARPAWDEGHAGRVLRKLERDIFPAFGHRVIGAIEPPDILAALRKVEARGAIDVTKRTRQYVGAIFRYAIATGRATRDPAADIRDALKAAPRVKHRARVDEKDLPDFLKRLDAYDGDEQTQLGIWLVLLTLLRTNEVRFGSWAEIENLDGDEPVWRIPAERMKMHRDHLVPLAPRTAEVLRRLRVLARGRPWILPAPTKTGVMSENTMLFALYRMGYRSRLTIHGLRGTGSTILNERDFSPDWIEMQLAHAPKNAVRSAYNAARWLPQRRKMLEWWADYLVDISSKR
jgi:integrase